MGKFKVGDVLVCKDPNAKKYVYTRGKDYIGIVVDTREDDSEDIRLEAMVGTKIIKKGKAYWVNSKYFKLKDEILEKAEDF